MKHWPAGLFLLLLALVYGLHPVGSSDLFWLLKIGQQIVFQQQFPQYDIFTWTALGTSWLNHEWLPAMCYAIVHKLGGFVALSWFSFFTLALYLGILFALFFRLSSNSILAIFLTSLVLLGSAFRIQQFRPEMFALLAFADFLFLLRVRRLNSLWKVFLLLCTWVLWLNSHASFYFGFLLLLLNFADDRENRKNTVFALLACVALSLLNPFGAQLLFFPWQHLNLHHDLSASSDWQALSLSLLPLKVSTVLLLSFVTWALWRCWKNRVLPIFCLGTALSLTAISCYLERFLPFALLSWAALIATTSSGENFVWWQQRRVLLGFSGAALVVFVVKISEPLGFLVDPVRPNWWVGEKFGVGLNTQDFPVAALDVLNHLGVGEKLFNDMAFGGYLIYRRWPEHKVFIDTRTPIYSEEFYKAYQAALFSPEAFAKLDEQYHFEAVLYDARQVSFSGGPLRFLQQDPKWKLVYQDAVAMLWLKLKS